MANAIGPDVSFYQDDPETPQGIDFIKMAANAKYVIIRSGQNLWVDPDFKFNWREARLARLPRGSYWFYDSRAEPKRQAELWAEQFGGDFGELPLFADFEEAYGGAYKGWRNWYTFLERVKQLVGDHEIGIYTAFFYWRSNAPNAVTNPTNLEYFHQYPLWIANYGVSQPAVPKPWSSDEWLFWQFTEAGDGKLYGVESNGIDLNYFHGDEQAFKTRFKIPDVIPPPPPPPPDGGTPTGRMYKVTASALKVREGPGTGFNSIGLLYLNEIVEEIGANSNRTWLRVRRLDGGLSGWSFAGYLLLIDATPPPPPPPDDGGIPTGKMYRVTATSLVMRAGPGIEFEQVGSLFLNDVVEEIGATADRTWLRVRKQDNSQRGWCSAAYLESVVAPPPPPPPDDGGVPTGKLYRVTVTSLVMRGGPGTEFSQVGSLFLNDVVEEIGANSDRTWLRVRKQDNSQRGWSFAAHLQSLEAPPPPPPPPDQGVRNWYRVNLNALPIRINPNGSARIVGTFAKEDTVGAIDDTSTPNWVKIRRVDGLTGWLDKRNLTLRGPTRPSSYRQRVFNGVSYMRKEVTDPRRILIHSISVDLRIEGLSFLVTPPSTSDGILCTRTTSQFLKEFGMQVAINGDGYKYLVPPDAPPNVCSEGDPVRPNGYAVSRRKVYSPIKTADPTVYINQRNEVTINQPKGEVVNAVSGDRIIVENGQVVKNLAAAVPNPRTALGLNKANTFLTFAVVDGREVGQSEGMTFPELAELMISLGCHIAVNMDGGGSSTMVIRGIDGQPLILNNPIDEGVPGKERKVGNHLGIVLKTP